MLTEDPTARREFFRVTIPESEYVTLATDSTEYRVVEISERGIRFESNEALAIEQWIRGKVTYDQDKSFALTGKVIRIETDDVSNKRIIVAGPLNLSMPQVIAFQSYLVRTYGKEGLSRNSS